MNKSLYMSFLFLLMIIIFSCIFSTELYKESFVPKIIKEQYRPIERNIRKTYEGFYSKSSTNISNFLRKIGMI